jgi:hypothetical protein
VTTKATSKTDRARGRAKQAGHSSTLEVLARAGLIAYAVVHLLIGWLALKIAWATSASTSADSSGAMKTLADQPFGKFLLAAVAAGLVALAVWQGSQAAWGYRDRDQPDRVRKQLTSAAKSLAYLALGVSAASIALGSRSSSSRSQQHATTGVLAWPAGQVLVVLAGLIIIAVGVASVIKGVTESFDEEIDTTQMSTGIQQGVERLGQLGYIAKGVALGLIGSLLGYAALTFEQRKARGLDGALQTILVQPFGKFLLTAVALGFVAFGLFALAQSRYRRM